jgi:hypothetical protein
VGLIPTGGAMQPEQATELVTKWSATGFLRDVKQQHLQRAAERLEAAWRRVTGGHSRDALDEELASMTRDGLFSCTK